MHHFIHMFIHGQPRDDRDIIYMSHLDEEVKDSPPSFPLCLDSRPGAGTSGMTQESAAATRPIEAAPDG